MADPALLIAMLPIGLHNDIIVWREVEVERWREREKPREGASARHLECLSVSAQSDERIRYRP